MDKRKYLDCIWIYIVWQSCIIGLASTCEVDDGAFVTTISVYEETEIGTAVGNLNFVSPGSIAKIEVVDGSPYFDYFPSNNTFVVTSRIDIDQGLNPVQIMILECMPMNGPTFEIEVEFELKDVNDFPPKFKPTNKYSARVSEAAIAGTQITLVDADDDDIKNAYVIYELQTSEHSSYFKLKPVSGGKAALTLEKSLDYESVKKYELIVVAKDCHNRQNCSDNQRTATAELTVTVEDADDLSPEFDLPTYTVSIFEDSIENTVVAQLVARDQDTLNAAIRYSIEGEGSRYFAVDRYTGMVTVADTDGMVKGTRYLLQAKAWQANDINKKTTATLVIKIIPTNGNAPQFSKSSFEITLPEGSPVGTSAHSFTVSDRDTTEQLKFSMVDYPSDFPFQLRVTGLKSANLVVSSTLDYENTKQYSAVVRVSDGEFMSEADVFITILNDNDHNPEFLNQDDAYEFELEWMERALVGTVQAIDKDAPEDEVPVTYKILPPHDRLFQVDNQGKITLKAAAEDYKSKEYLINVQAMDTGSSPRSSTTVVRIKLSLPDGGTTAASTNVSADNSGPNKDRLVIYIVAGIAGFLLILVALFVMCFLKRKAKKTARQLQRKDCEQMTFDNPYNTNQSSTDTLKSVTDSQMTYKTQTTMIVSEDDTSESVLSSVATAELSAHLSLSDGNLQSQDYKEMKISSDEENAAQKHSEPNNLSVISDNERAYIEVAAASDNNNRNIPAVEMTQPSDSGRSSMRDRSPYVKRIPFQSFLHPKSSSIDETGIYHQDEEIALASLHDKRSRGATVGHSNSFNAGHYRPNVSNIRATDDLPMRYCNSSQHSVNSAFIAEAPVGFRSDSHRAVSPQSGTSDYESNSPSPGLSANSIIDYCADLPTQLKDSRTRLSLIQPGEGFWSKKTISGSLYKPQAANNMSASMMERSDTPCTEVSTETDSISNGELEDKPQMTIYF